MTQRKPQVGGINTRVTEGAYQSLTAQANDKDLTLYAYIQLVLQAVARGDTDMVVSLMNKRE